MLRPDTIAAREQVDSSTTAGRIVCLVAVDASRVAVLTPSPCWQSISVAGKRNAVAELIVVIGVREDAMGTPTLGSYQSLGSDS
ncbi:MAG: hypothetical protein WED11_00045, partial [Natronospirillum sp.]